MSDSRLRLRGSVEVRHLFSSGEASTKTYDNTATDWARNVLAQLIMTVANGESTSTTQSRPLYIALGTGTGSASHTDLAMFQETYNTRKAISYTSAFQAFVAQFTTNYQTTDPNGTFTEAGLWDGPVVNLSLASATAVGATSISLSGSTPAVYGVPVAGQATRLYINDATNPEYALLAQTYNAGVTTWTLQKGLTYAHASATPVVVFSGNLWAHVVFGGAGETKGTGEALTVQWSVYLDA